MVGEHVFVTEALEKKESYYSLLQERGSTPSRQGTGVPNVYRCQSLGWGRTSQVAAW
jgi:hypothetical protein